MAHEQAKKPTRSRMDPEELSILCEQIALILRSGLPLHDGMEALNENYRQTRLAGRFETLYQSVLDTGSLYQGIINAGIFPQYMSEMALIGERTGELDSVMEGLSAYYHREAKIRRAIISAVTYPLILIAIMATLIVVLITRVLPIFEDVFRSMGVDTSTNPWMTAGIGTGKVVLIIAGVLILLTLISLLIMRLDRSGRFRNTLFRWVGPMHRLETKIAASRFASVMAMMLRSGFPLEESLKLIGGILCNEDVALRVNQCRVAMQAGMSFPDAVEKLGLFEPLHVRMLRVGHEAGQTDLVMAKLAEIYEDEVDDAITHAVSIIEPTLVALMSVIIGAILLAVMLPLLAILGGMA